MTDQRPHPNPEIERLLLRQEGLKALREPFPEETVGKLPATPKRPIELDYVGHAAVTDRLLSVDPAWTWEPLALDERGLPAYDNAGGLWIKLTICGVTRLGYGDGPDPKQRIGDAIRNAGMRFGIALYLWGKDELESLIGNETVRATKRRPSPKSATPVVPKPARARVDPKPTDKMSAQDRNTLRLLLNNASPPVRSDAEVTKFLNEVLGARRDLAGITEPLKGLSDVFAGEAEMLFKALEAGR